MKDRQPLRKRLTQHFAWWKYVNLDRRRGCGHPESAAQWDRDYVAGYWDKLSSIAEIGRFGVIAAYIMRLKPAGRILDLGCGTGLLLNYLHPESFQIYHGVDLSDVAIKQACEKWTLKKLNFSVESIENFSTQQQFDIIVFNEVLYYLDDPSGAVKRLSNVLSIDGLFIISMADQSGYYIWKKLAESFEMLDLQRISNRESDSWQVGVLRRR